MNEILEDFRKALSEAQKKGIIPSVKKQETVSSALDMAVLHYKQEKEKQEKMARLFFC
jgi:hypothetical protein